MNILFTVFTALTMMGLVAGDALDDFSGTGNGGRCYSSGCTSGRTCAKYCYGFIGNLASLEVDDNDGQDFDLGVENCAKACAGYGENGGKKVGLPADKNLWPLTDEYQGEFVCNSFDYRPEKASNCFLHQNPSRGTQGGRPGSTRVDYTEYYCYTRISTPENSVGKLPCNTVPPTASPTVESTSCQDDESWTYVNRNGITRDCAYVARNPDKRCSNAGAEKFAGSVQACCACK